MIICLLVIGLMPSKWAISGDPIRVRVERIDGGVHLGQLIEWSRTQVTLGAAGKPVVVDRHQLRRMLILDDDKDSRPAHPLSAVRFVNDDWLLVDDVRIQDDLLIVQRSAAGEHTPVRFEFPLSSVQRLLFGTHEESTDPAETGLATVSGDIALLTNGHRIPGELLSLDENLLQMETVLGPVRIERSRLRQIDFDPALLSDPPDPPESLLLTLRDGSIISAREITFTPSGSWTGKLAWGTLFEFSGADIRRIDRYAPEIISLVGMMPVLSEHRDFFGGEFVPRANRNLPGKPMTIQEETFGRGVGTSSRSRLVVSIPSRSRWFTAAIALDDAAGSRGAVAAAILVDGHVLWSRDVVTQADGLIPIGPLEVHGAEELTLFVDFGPGGDVQDFVNWIDPVFLIPPDVGGIGTE